MSGYTNDQLKRIQDWNSRQEKPVRLTCVLPGTDRDDRFDHLSEYLETIAPNIRVDREHILPGWIGNRHPGLLLKDTVYYSALPYEHELDPFLSALDWLTHPPAPDPPVKTLLDRIESPVPLTLYIAQACPHCPALVRTVMAMAVNCDMIRLEIIDGTLFPEAAGKDTVLAAPCLILGNDFRWTGPTSAEEIGQMMVSRDPSAFSVQSLKAVLEDGRASWITDQMIRHGRIFENFYGLLLHDIWSVRLGAMVIVEDMAEKSPELALQMCDRLVREFDGRDATIQGDILYALGEAGNRDTLIRIDRLMETVTDENVKEAAAEARESIEARC